MNISYNWLKRYINLSDSADEVAKILTSIGLEVGTVETVQTIKGGLEGLVVGEVITCEPHPNSDHLHITTTRVAPDAEPLQIVCGAANVAAGQKVIVATLGTVLYSGEESFTIKKSKIRGTESFGMICAEDEIGVGSSHDGIMVLPAETPVGMPAKEYFHIEDDTLIEVDITPNRSDAASHFGVARDLYAYYQAHGHNEITLTKPDISAFAVQNHDLTINVDVENTDACPRYAGVSIKGVEVKDSPDWLKKAISTIGLRPINNIVDVTNFVLHEMGQALHAFDADKIADHKIIVRNAMEGAKFTTLDDIERTLCKDDLMICNTREPMCIAGVFGGKDSGVTASTKNIFIESAYFNPVTIRKTARRQALNTDASFRYERGVDPNNTIYVLKRCALLVQEVAGGEISMDVVDIKSQEFPNFPVEFSMDRCNHLIGKEIGEQTIETIFKALEITFDKKENGIYQLGIPPYRVDVQRECDVVEDVLRIYGYNNVELSESLHSNLAYSVKPNSVALQTRISEQLTAQGFNEILNNSLTKVAYYENLTSYPLANCVKVMNPLSQDLGVMRQTLLFGGLESISRNANRKNADIKFYEFGNCYHFREIKEEEKAAKAETPLMNYSEESHLGLWLSGNKTAQSWVRPEEKTSFYELHAYVNNILRRLGVKLERCSYDGFANDLFADGMRIIAPTGKEIGYMGIVSKQVRDRFDIDNDVFFADLNWKVLLKLNKQYKPNIVDLPKFPAVKRDLALLVDKQVQFADLQQAAFETDHKLLKQVYLFDVYEGKSLPFGMKSYALSFILQDENNTLKDKQIENIMSRLQSTFESRFNAKLR